MSLASYWRNRRVGEHGYLDSHLAVTTRLYVHPVFACSIWPFVASEVTGAQVTKNHKEPTCKECRSHLEWLLTQMVLDDLREKARAAGVLGK